MDIKILDLQTLHPGSPVADLFYFIFSGSDEEFRAKYYEKLLDHYYTQLSSAMKRLNLDPEETYSRKDFDYEIREVTNVLFILYFHKILYCKLIFTYLLKYLSSRKWSTGSWLQWYFYL